VSAHRGDYTVSQFFVTDEFSAIRARDAVVAGEPITISGTGQDGVGVFIGVVESVEEISPQKWQITIRDGK
jgi:hypothetical protein